MVFDPRDYKGRSAGLGSFPSLKEAGVVSVVGATRKTLLLLSVCHFDVDLFGLHLNYSERIDLLAFSGIFLSCFCSF